MLHESDLQADPIRQFARWFHDAIEAKIPLAEGMTLATADGGGRPSARVVLLKDFDERGFTFYTNFRSRKAAELDINPHAALCFWWGALERQVRIEGEVARVDDAESDAYFATRPRGSQIGAWASPQSRAIESREVLEENAHSLIEQYAGKVVPRPAHWGGYRLVPRVLEFWQNRDDRLHDRFRYDRLEEEWKITRLGP
ncbi:MAG: pyridoxamine 5'-phosphate oxidase [Thermoanaerobaculia bacterium]